MFVQLRRARAAGIGALALVLLKAPAAIAEAAPDGRAWFDAGVRAYEDAHYAAAIAAFEEAYRLTKRPGLLFSIAQAYRRSYDASHDAAHLRAALRYYARYLSENPGGDHRSEAGALMDELGRLPDAKDWQLPDTASAPRTQIIVAVNVRAAELRLDGEQIETLPHAAEVTPGKHHVTVSAEGYEAYERDVEVEKGAVLPLDIRLEASTTRLEISGDQGAELFVDGQRAGRLPVRALALRPGRHSVEVRDTGHYAVSQTIELRAGERRRLRLAGAATTRRTLSWVLVGSGAAAGVAGGLLGYLALRREDEARSLQDRPGTGPAFETAISARNDLRLAAALSGGAGVVAIVAGTISLLTEGNGPRGASAEADAHSAQRQRLAWSGLGLHGSF